MEIVLTFITWLLLYCGLLVHAVTKGDNDFRASDEENEHGRKEMDQKWQINVQCPNVNTNVIMEGKLVWLSGERPLAFALLL